MAQHLSQAVEPDPGGAYANFRNSSQVISESELAEWWAALPSTPVHDMIGLWRGGLFDTGHPFNRRDAGHTWFGKDIRAVDDAFPTVCVNADQLRYLAPVHGSMWTILFRGEPTASLIYDDRPVIDHFKTVDADTRLGVMNRPEDRKSDRWLYFWLERFVEAP